MTTAAATKLVYDFAEGSKDMRDLLGGKGANVAEMTRVLGADRVPAGFTITTEACVAYMKSGDQEFPDGLQEEVEKALDRLEEQAEKKLGDSDDPLLVSVRSGARESMPGMLDTVLNLGLNDESVEGLARTTDNERFAWDSYRRFVQMFGNVCRGIKGERFEELIEESKREHGVEDDVELGVGELKDLTARFKEVFEEETGEGFPRIPRSSCARRSAPCSTRGQGSERSATGASTTSRTSGARPSTCSRWCSATAAMSRARASHSRATR